MEEKGSRREAGSLRLEVFLEQAFTHLLPKTTRLLPKLHVHQMCFAN